MAINSENVVRTDVLIKYLMCKDCPSPNCLRHFNDAEYQSDKINCDFLYKFSIDAQQYKLTDFSDIRHATQFISNAQNMIGFL